MLTKLFIASLVTLSASTTIARADQPDAPVPGIQRMPKCSVTTNVPTSLFQIKQDSTQVQDFVSSNLSVFTNGAWTYQELTRGKVTRAEGGCLAAADLATLRSALTPVTWKWTSGVHCDALAMSFTEYSYKSTVVLRTELCDGKILDDKTSKGLAAATAITNTILAGVNKRTP